MRYLFFFLLTLLLAGCGSDASSPGGPTAVAPLAPTYQGFILGRVKLEKGLCEGPVEIKTPEGGVLHRLRADKHGWFHTTGELPTAFRVEAQRGEDLYVSEYRQGWRRGTLYVNAATTMASAWWQAHPEADLAEAERKVHAYLKLPAPFKLSWVSTINCETFDTARFFGNVRAAGGLKPYLATLVKDMDSPPRFSALGDFGWEMLKAAGTGLESATVNDAVGSVVSKMGFNFTTAGALTQIQDALVQVSAQVAALSQQLQGVAAVEALAATLKPLQTNADNIQITVNNITMAITAFNQTHGSGGTPFNTPSQYPALASTVSQVQNLNLSENLDPIVSALNNTGPSGLYQLLVVQQMTAMSQEHDTSFNHYPWRFNTLTRQQANLVGSFINTISQGGELACEYANLQQQLAPALVEAGNQTRSLAENVAAAAQQVPDLLPSDELILDCPNQVMWVNSFYGAANYTDASNTADNLEIGPYDDWMLPSQQMVLTLIYDRANYIANLPTDGSSTWGNVDTSTYTGAFQKLGFDTTNYTQVSYTEDGITGYSTGTTNNEGSWINTNNNKSQNLEMWNGTALAAQSNPSSSSGSDGYDNTTTSYLICRQFPGDPETNAPHLDSTLVPLSTVQYYPAPYSMGMLVLGSDNTPAPGSISVINSTGGQAQLNYKQSFGTGFYLQQDTFGTSTDGGQYDVTRRAVWRSSNPAAASISNFIPVDPSPFASPLPSPIPSPPADVVTECGVVTWHPPLSGSPLPSVTFTASLYGTTNIYGTSTGNVSQTITLNPPAGLQPVLKQVNALPINQVYNVNGHSQLLNCTLIAYYQDGQIIDVSTDANTTWTLRDANNQVVNSSTVGGFGVESGTTKNQLYLTSNITTSNVTYTGTYNGPWGSASCNGTLGLITAPPAPTSISNVFPGRVSIRSSNSRQGVYLTLVGQAFNGTTNVTVGGVASPNFVVNSDTQITAKVPGWSGAAGIQPVVVTAPGGTGSVNITFTSP